MTTENVATTPAGPNQETTEIVNVALGDSTADAAAALAAEQAAASTVAKDAEVVYDPSGDAGLDIALKFVGKLGYGPDHAAMVAARSGDLSLIRAELATKGEKAAGWQEHVALAEQAINRQKDAAVKQQAEVGAMVQGIAGGKEAWAAVQSWASANATAEEKASINAQFAAGGLQAKMAAQYLCNAYNRAAGVTKEPKAAASANAGAQPGAATNGPMSAKEYADAVIALSQSKGGRDVTETAEYRQLQQRRIVGRRTGK